MMYTQELEKYSFGATMIQGITKMWENYNAGKVESKPSLSISAVREKYFESAALLAIDAYVKSPFEKQREIGEMAMESVKEGMLPSVAYMYMEYDWHLESDR